MSMELANVVARAVRAERARHRLSQSELAARLGWSTTKLSMVESGSRRVYFHELPALCFALEVSLLGLLEAANPLDIYALGLDPSCPPA